MKQLKTNYELSSQDSLTKLAVGLGIKTWQDLVEYVQKLPYGRNKNRTEFALVLTEQKGTCSSKHAVLKKIADQNKIPAVKLILGIYKMNAQNTPNIGTIIGDSSIAFIPEAHCYLMIQGRYYDFTTQEADFSQIEKDILHEKEISPEQVVDFKVDYHRSFLKEWLIDTKSTYNLDEIWKIREQCIENLTM